MKKSYVILISLIALVLVAVVCALVLPKYIFQTTSGGSGYSIVWGVAEDTKDGYYVGGNVLTEEEILNYNPDYKSGSYTGKTIEIEAKTRTVTTDECTAPGGEIVQCRPGESVYVYDIKSIKDKNI
jgi:hypothetical protein